MTDESAEGEAPAIEEMSFEEAAEELESIIDRLERGDVPLEDGLDAYGRGRSLLARCRGILDTAAARIEDTDREDSDAG